MKRSTKEDALAIIRAYMDVSGEYLNESMTKMIEDTIKDLEAEEVEPTTYTIAYIETYESIHEITAESYEEAEKKLEEGLREQAICPYGEMVESHFEAR